MSWQEYVDDHLMYDLGNDRRLTSAAIVGVDGVVWAQSAAFPKVEDAELSTIVAGFDDSNALAQNGLFVGGEKYMVIQGVPGEVIRGKKGASGITIKKTTSALVVGIYGELVAPGECSTLVEKLGDYLIEQGI